MTKSIEITKRILADLGSIGQYDGYINNDVTILDGWLIHYVRNDLNQQSQAVSFPCVAVQPHSETVNAKPNSVAGVARTYKIIGAVACDDPETVTDNLDSLLYDVRNALSFDREATGNSPAIRVNLGDVVYKLPESQHGKYAYFELEVDYVYAEEWKQRHDQNYTV